jgi:predicted phosphohydrolase
MLIQFCSDLHLEFPENRLLLKRNSLPGKGKVLILAGDIVPFAGMEKHFEFFDYISGNFDQTYWVPGNHEYYGSDAGQKSGELNERIRSNVFLVNNFAIELEGLSLLFTTLWTHIRPRYQWNIERSLNDFSVIRFQGHKLTVAQVNEFHSENIAFIHEQIEKRKGKKIVVVSHHVPTFFNYPEIYKGSEINEAFGTELFDLIHDSGIDYWIYGHHHVNVPDFKIGNTSLITNQMGYVRNNEQQGFDPGRCLEL